MEEWPAGNLSVDASASYPARPVPVSGPPAHHDPELAVANAAAFAMLAGDEVTPAVTPSVGVAVGTVGEPRGRVVSNFSLNFVFDFFLVWKLTFCVVFVGSQEHVFFSRVSCCTSCLLFVCCGVALVI